MVFSSLPFLFLFLPIFLIIYFVSPSRTARNIVLVLGSLIFYAWGQPIWICMLLGSAVVDYGNGLFIEWCGRRPIRVVGVFVTLIFNLGLLISSKYAGFIVDNVNLLIGAHFRRPDVLLPAGMSFYTFETISYTLDVYRGQIRAQRSLLKFLVFIASFPRLVAGPIIRYNNVAQAIDN